MATFVLVPGAWLGGWAWEDTARVLRAHGHTALPVTLTGMSEREDLASRDTGPGTHADDVVSFVEDRDLRHVTLVAHSYAAAPVSAAVGRLSSRLERVVYVESAPFVDGVGLLDLTAPDEVEWLRKRVAELGGGWRLPPADDLVGPVDGSPDGLTEEQRARVRPQVTPQPFGTFEQRVAGAVEPGPDVDRVLVACNNFQKVLDSGLPVLAPLLEAPWRRYHLATGHWPMISAPVELAGTLDAAVSPSGSAPEAG